MSMVMVLGIPLWLHDIMPRVSGVSIIKIMV